MRGMLLRYLDVEWLFNVGTERAGNSAGRVRHERHGVSMRQTPRAGTQSQAEAFKLRRDGNPKIHTYSTVGNSVAYRASYVEGTTSSTEHDSVRWYHKAQSNHRTSRWCVWRTCALPSQ